MGKVSVRRACQFWGGSAPTIRIFAPAREISFAEIICPEGGSIEDRTSSSISAPSRCCISRRMTGRRFEHLLSWSAINDLLSQTCSPEAARALRGTDVTFPRLYIGKTTAISMRWTRGSCMSC